MDDPNLLLIAIALILTAVAWRKWSTDRAMLTPVRAGLFLAGLCVSSIALIEYSLLTLHVHRNGGFGDNFSAFLSWARPGFFTSLIALSLTATGRGRSRICAVAASFELMAVWIILVSGM
jgi:hypothetical protein